MDRSISFELELLGNFHDNNKSLIALQVTEQISSCGISHPACRGGWRLDAAATVATAATAANPD